MKSAVCLADVDNDGEYELVIGNSAGDLAIFKGTGKKWIFDSCRQFHQRYTYEFFIRTLFSLVLVRRKTTFVQKIHA